eukprot:2391914-Rhodomonas_salina.1
MKSVTYAQALAMSVADGRKPVLFQLGFWLRGPEAYLLHLADRHGVPVVDHVQHSVQKHLCPATSQMEATAILGQTVSRLWMLAFDFAVYPPPPRW